MNEVIWVAPVIQPPEFRLYYDDTGKVLFYSGEKLPGNYIEIDALTYAEGRYDVMVLDGKLIRDPQRGVVGKLAETAESGSICTVKEDISIVVDENYDGEINKWKIKFYEL